MKDGNPKATIPIGYAIIIVMTVIVAFIVSYISFGMKVEEARDSGYQSGYEAGYESAKEKAVAFEESDLTTYTNQSYTQGYKAGQNRFENGMEDFVVNTNTGKFHKLECEWAQKIAKSNRYNARCSRQALIDEGYAPCKVCCP